MKISKDPDATLDYDVNWSPDEIDAPEGPWLSGGDTIATSTWIVPDGLTKTSESATATKTKVWLSGGTCGAKYLVTNRITTVQGRTEDKSFTIVVENH